MRIISGTLKGRKIPNVFNVKDVNPSSDMIKGALFSILGDEINNKIFCDLYAGTGNIGFEALSRGADSCIFLESFKKMALLIGKTANEFKVKDKVKTICGDVINLINKNFLETYLPDIIFLDPPYELRLGGKTLEAIAGKVSCRSCACDYRPLIIVQHDKKEILQNRYEDYFLTKEKIYGRSALSFYENIYEYKKTAKDDL